MSSGATWRCGSKGSPDNRPEAKQRAAGLPVMKGSPPLLARSEVLQPSSFPSRQDCLRTFLCKALVT